MIEDSDSNLPGRFSLDSRRARPLWFLSLSLSTRLTIAGVLGAVLLSIRHCARNRVPRALAAVVTVPKNKKDV